MPININSVGSSGIGGSSASKGFGVGRVGNLSAESGDSTIFLKWSDPIDVVVDDVVLAKWKGTLVVRKLGSYPENPKDGTVICDSTVRNQYVTEPFMDTDVINDTTYYYRLFPYTDQNIFNLNAINTICANATEIYATFQKNSWDKIKAGVNMGLYNTLWSIGDTKDVRIGNETWTFEIAAFDYDLDGRENVGTTKTLPITMMSQKAVWPSGKGAQNNEYYTDRTWYMNRWNAWISSHIVESAVSNIWTPIWKRAIQRYNDTSTSYSSYGDAKLVPVKFDGFAPVLYYEYLGNLNNDINNHTANIRSDEYNYKSTLKKYPVFTDATSYVNHDLFVFGSSDYSCTEKQQIPLLDEQNWNALSIKQQSKNYIPVSGSTYSKNCLDALGNLIFGIGKE